MAILSGDAILNVDDTTRETVNVPEWGGDVIVRGLTGTERDAYEASCSQIRGKETVPVLTNVRAKLVVRSLVDESGARLFADADAAKLGAKSGAVIDRLFDVAARLSGLTDADAEELAGNSDAA